MTVILQLFFLYLLFARKTEANSEEPAVKVFTVATEDTHGLQRFLRSTKMHGIDVEILGMGQKWDGGNMKNPGGGQKVKLLKQKILSMQKLPDREQIIIFTDSYDVMYLADLNVIVDKFKSMDVRVLFAAEPFCWPDASLAKKYPNTTVTNPYLNSGGIIGYLPELKKILNMKEIANRDDDQLFFTEAYLNEDLRLTYHLALDHKSEIFQNLHGALSDIKLITNSTTECPYLVNLLNNARPLIVHGNGPSKITLNHFSNYLNHAWSVTDGCTLCEEKRIELNEDKLPTVMIAVFVEQTTPFMEEFLQQLVDIDYPKNKIHFYLHNSVEYHGTDIDDFFRAHSVDYLSAKCIKPSDFISEGEARNIAKGRCVNTECDYLLSIDSLSRVDPSTLRYLITTGYDVVAPLLLRTGQSWSNFWGAINSAGYYARSTDYMDIVNRKIIGIWNVPFIANIYLINMELFRKESLKEVSYLKDELDADMAFCSELRDHGVMMHVSNEKVLGHLINPESYDVSRKNPDIYQVMDNQEDWEQRYLHAEYFDSFDDGRNHSMPCPDVYWFPMVTLRFCKEWIEIMEAFGQWSDGSNQDKRLESGYEAVPTRDIHMSQVGLDKQWLYILKSYVRPLQERVFIGYYHNPPVSLMNFVVRYRPDEQPSLRPHHDSSTYTINLALNTPNVDYEGGGCHFIRYNCSVKNTKPGWLLMHPGRLTHFHEGLRVTNGTRYIMISFVDP
ncbi:procollagen-lysine,2-oxoglutarate 5-dioxygenase isoform X2 [Pararge aegeria]|uniref:procollagen-lysine,2-oxoglutarate 5-dioxygenase isoform X2 n=1 Tax=Pararge aegeria TaxID=116150 RepID=UPI0019D1CA74|nr:procollagen-lysine,2-oxoglutarate 5-dioxygenase isoform X2 [Pararge aegeria]